MALLACHYFGIILYIAFFFFFSLPTNQSSLTLHGWDCEYTRGNYTRNSTYNSNLLNVFSNLISLSSFNTFNNLTEGADADKVYALYNCREDFTAQTCHSCVENGTMTLLQRCPSKEATILFAECILRYANRMIFSTVEFDPRYAVAGPWFGLDRGVINRTVGPIFKRVMDEAANSRRYFATEEAIYAGYQNIYCLVECRPDLSKGQCKECLLGLFNFTLRCANDSRLYCVFIAPSCQMIYSVLPFFNLSSDLPPTAFPPGLPPVGAHRRTSHANSDSHLYSSIESLTFSLLLFIVGLL